MGGVSLTNVACAHAAGCVVSGGQPAPAYRHWKGIPYCRNHYNRAMRNGGDPGPVGAVGPSLREARCAHPEGGLHAGRWRAGASARRWQGIPYCRNHYSRARKHDRDPGPPVSYSLRGVSCAHPGGCVIGDGRPARAAARWNGVPCCRSHYSRAKYSGGDPGPPDVRSARLNGVQCEHPEGCERPAYCRYDGIPYCSLHYNRLCASRGLSLARSVQ